jgi:hypothetical protein
VLSLSKDQSSEALPALFISSPVFPLWFLADLLGFSFRDPWYLWLLPSWSQWHLLSSKESLTNLPHWWPQMRQIPLLCALLSCLHHASSLSCSLFQSSTLLPQKILVNGS